MNHCLNIFLLFLILDLDLDNPSFVSILFQSFQSDMLEAQKSKGENEAVMLRHPKSLKDQAKAHATILIKKNTQLQMEEKKAPEYHDMCFEMV